MSDPEKEERIQGLYEQLKEAIEVLDDAKVARIADTLLKENHDDNDALKCKIIAHIQLGSAFPETASLFARLDDQTQQEMALEKAYCMYRMGKLDEATSLLAKVGEDRAADRALLQAQVLYRQGKFSEAASAFENVIKAHAKEIEHPSDVRSNVIAAYVSGSRSDLVPKVLETMKISPTSAGFEAAFNIACGLLESGKYAEAGAQLEVAARLGREQLMEDDVEADEIDLELAPVSVQSAYLASLRGDWEGSKKTLEGIVGNEAQKDPVTLAVSHNNLIAVKSRFLDVDAVTGMVKSAAKNTATAPNPKDLLRVLERVLDCKGTLSLHLPTQLDQRLSERQKCALHCNRALLMIMTDKVEDARQLAQAAAQRYPLQDFPALLRAALLAKEGKTLKAYEALEDFCQRSAAAVDASSLQDIRLLQLQLVLCSNKPDDRKRALDVIKACDPSLRAQPAMLSTALHICTALGLAGEAESLLQSALEATSDSERRSVIMLELADVKSGSGDYTAAMDLLDRSAGESDAPDSVRSAAVGRALRLKALQPSLQLGKSLVKVQSSLPEPTCAADVTQLESGYGGAVQQVGVPVPASQRMDVDRPAAVTAVSDPMEAAAARQARYKRKRDKKREKYLASKGLDDKKQADPERWLPKEERSDFKPKKQKKDGPVVKGAQGSGKVDDALDAKKGGGAGPSSSAAPAAKKSAMPNLPGKKKPVKK